MNIAALLVEGGRYLNIRHHMRGRENSLSKVLNRIIVCMILLINGVLFA